MSHLSKRQIKAYIQQLKEKNYASASIYRVRKLLSFFHRIGFTKQTVDAYQGHYHYLKANTKKNYFYILSQFLALYYPKLVKHIVIPKVPFELPKKIPTEDEVKIILSGPDITTYGGIRDRVILELFYGSGIRLSELSNIKLEDLDLEKHILRVCQGKNKKDRIVPVSKAGCAWVRKYIKKVRTLYLPKENYLIVGKWGGRMYVGYPGDIVKKYGEFSPHKYRHGFATHLLRGGMKETSLQRLLGHAQISTTQIYTKVTVPDLLAAYRKYHPRDNWKR
jgi:site-specific recombinase XerD